MAKLGKRTYEFCFGPDRHNLFLTAYFQVKKRAKINAINISDLYWKYMHMLLFLALIFFIICLSTVSADAAANSACDTPNMASRNIVGFYYPSELYKAARDYADSLEDALIDGVNWDSYKWYTYSVTDKKTGKVVWFYGANSDYLCCLSAPEDADAGRNSFFNQTCSTNNMGERDIYGFYPNSTQAKAAMTQYQEAICAKSTVDGMNNDGYKWWTYSVTNKDTGKIVYFYIPKSDFSCCLEEPVDPDLNRNNLFNPGCTTNAMGERDVYGFYSNSRQASNAIAQYRKDICANSTVDGINHDTSKWWTYSVTNKDTNKDVYFYFPKSGELDCLDQCPDDPDKVEPGICGCGTPDKDSDGDSVLDCEDECPSTPSSCQTDSNGCAINSDGDANADCYELCPDDPTATTPGPCGCSSDPNGTKDDDGDKVVNCLDQCPQKAGTLPNGCNDGSELGRDSKNTPQIPCSEFADPVSILSGNHIEDDTDVQVASPFGDGLTFKRFYNSRGDAQSSIGLGWTHNYNLSLKIISPQSYPGLCKQSCDFETRSQVSDDYPGWNVVMETQPAGGVWGKVTLCPDGSCDDVGPFETVTYCKDFEVPCLKSIPLEVTIEDETGFGHHFEGTSAGSFVAKYGDDSRLTREGDLYIWRKTDGSRVAFAADTLKPVYLEDRNGNRQTLTYDAASNLLTRVTDSGSGRSLHFEYTDGRISSVHLLTQESDQGELVAYEYDENGNLTRVTYPDGSGLNYAYDDPQKDPDSTAHLNNMTRKSDAAGHLLATWAYDEKDRCIANETPDGRGMIFDYDRKSDAVVLTDAYGVTQTYHLATINGKKRITAVEGSTCSQEAIRIEYDSQGNVTEKEFANGRIDRYNDYDSRGNARSIVQAAGTAEEHTVAYTWHPVLSQPLTHSESSVLTGGAKTTIWDYDDDGNDIANENPTLTVHRIIVDGVTLDPTGAPVPVSAVTRFAYNSRGQLVAIDGPLGGSADTTTLVYDPVTADLTAVTRPLAGTVTYSQFDAEGRPGRITDANGNVSAYTYDAAGRPAAITRLWDNGVTRFTYTLAGKPGTVILPDGDILIYQYDPVYGRLTAITDAAGNRSTHEYDAQGNLSANGYFSPTGERAFWQGFDYHSPQRPGKLWKSINPDGSAYEYAYDKVGNLAQVIDPSGRITAYAADSLNRRIATIQPSGVATGYQYDSQGHLTQVTDPGGVGTTYVADDLGRTVKTDSPDSGVTTYTYDAASNLIAKTDANRITVTYVYDAESRLTAVRYPDPSQDVTLTYDDGPNGLGRLTGRTDNSGSYAFAYDPAGNLVSETKTIDGIGYTTGYAYTKAGRLAQMTYPDGLVVNYQRDAAGNVTQVTSERSGVVTLLADNITYLPFGPLKSMTLGNGLTVDRAYDQSYRLTENRTDGVQNQQYTRDPVGNVTALTDTLDATVNLSLIYDDLYRLTGADGSFGSLWFVYDANGNRTMRTSDSDSASYQYTPGTNQLALITRDAMTDVVSDAAGNTIQYGALDLTYDAANRLSEVEREGVVLGSYTYGADGRRVKKIADGQTTHFHYDLTGKLIAESDGQGVFTQLYIYLEDTPLALVVVKDKQNGNAKEKNKLVKQKQALKGTYFYHTDHLGTPRRITDRDGKLVWAADYLPFGQAVVTLEKVENNLRFAGQYEDSETGLHYNYWRYYDPAIGRYLTPDPIGLNGGINLFAYVYNNPARFTDQYGLDVNAIFDRRSGTLTITDNQTGNSVTAKNVFSGNGQNANNPAAQGIIGSGPLPGGKYLIGNSYKASGHPGDNQWYRLYGDDGKGGYSYDKIPVNAPAGNPVYRGGFNLHTGRASDGCVTVYSDVNRNDPRYPTSKQFDQIKQLLDSTKPLKYKGSTYRGILIVK